MKSPVEQNRRGKEARGKHTPGCGYKPLDHWVVCDSCSFDIRASDAKYTWDNRVVCPVCWEPRHPQDFVRTVPDRSEARDPVRPPPEDIIIPVTFQTICIPSEPTQPDNISTADIVGGEGGSNSFEILSDSGNNRLLVAVVFLVNQGLEDDLLIHDFEEDVEYPGTEIQSTTTSSGDTYASMWYWLDDDLPALSGEYDLNISTGTIYQRAAIVYSENIEQQAPTDFNSTTNSPTGITISADPEGTSYLFVAGAAQGEQAEDITPGQNFSVSSGNTLVVEDEPEDFPAGAFSYSTETTSATFTDPTAVAQMIALGAVFEGATAGGGGGGEPCEGLSPSVILDTTVPPGTFNPNTL